ncbi:hypothetical protein C7M84_015530 [Penaeus vannamei]|uniref:Uncharacterized protein n=1 Tax=Penaeus vannamei TaxID=6689 RepID=A0A423SQH6_PENVA|nr:hypothetical protein C7M84_015530 [Penaeus vannamei]
MGKARKRQEGKQRKDVRGSMGRGGEGRGDFRPSSASCQILSRYGKHFRVDTPRGPGGRERAFLGGGDHHPSVILFLSLSPFPSPSPPLTPRALRSIPPHATPLPLPPSSATHASPPLTPTLPPPSRHASLPPHAHAPSPLTPTLPSPRTPTRSPPPSHAVTPPLPTLTPTAPLPLTPRPAAPPSRPRPQDTGSWNGDEGGWEIASLVSVQVDRSPSLALTLLPPSCTPLPRPPCFPSPHPSLSTLYSPPLPLTLHPVLPPPPAPCLFLRSAFSFSFLFLLCSSSLMFFNLDRQFCFVLTPAILSFSLLLSFSCSSFVYLLFSPFLSSCSFFSPLSAPSTPLPPLLLLVFFLLRLLSSTSFLVFFLLRLLSSTSSFFYSSSSSSSSLPSTSLPLSYL